MWVLGIDPGSSARTSVVNCWAISLAPDVSFFWLMSFHWLNNVTCMWECLLTRVLVCVCVALVFLSPLSGYLGLWDRVSVASTPQRNVLVSPVPHWGHVCAPPHLVLHSHQTQALFHSKRPVRERPPQLNYLMGESSSVGGSFSSPWHSLSSYFLPAIFFLLES